MDNLRILYSFPHAIGKPGIGWTAYQQVTGLSRLGHDVIVSSTSLGLPLPGRVEAITTLAAGGVRLPHRALGQWRTLELHDRLTARLLSRTKPLPDVVHVWPGATRHTAATAAALGVPVFRECPNTHTANALAVAKAESTRLGLELPRSNSHRDRRGRLAMEEREYQVADFLLVPSDSVRESFVSRGFGVEKVVTHQYGYDASTAPAARPSRPPEPLVCAYVGSGEPRKGLHLALEAWFASGASDTGELVIVGRVLPDMARLLKAWLEHPSVRQEGFVADVGRVLAGSHALLLPSLEEGSALVTYEAQGWGCALLVSDSTGAKCEHGVNGLVHPAGDVAKLAGHLRSLHQDSDLVDRLGEGAWAGRNWLTWDAAAAVLVNAYSSGVERFDAVA